MNFNHLKEVNETYFEHFKFAVLLALLVLWGAFCIGVHSIFPFLFVTGWADTVRRCNRAINKRFPEKVSTRRKVHI